MQRLGILLFLVILISGCRHYSGRKKPAENKILAHKVDCENVNRESIGTITYYMVGRMKPVEVNVDKVPFTVTVFQLRDEYLNTQIGIRILDLEKFELTTASPKGVKLKTKRTLELNCAHECYEIGIVVKAGKGLTKKHMGEVITSEFAVSVSK
ncbi:MAG TPA: hypothetical protein VK177_05370 [Flavobacteriales bacterium]|nr:hypothetical protein [Flavobacteriales bacterium]